MSISLKTGLLFELEVRFYISKFTITVSQAIYIAAFILLLYISYSLVKAWLES